MSGLLPSTPEVSGDPDPDPRVIGLDSEDASQLLAALSSDTTRDVLAALHDEPATPSQLADRVETSLQNAQYHLEKLENAELIEEVDTWYSEKGREMSVYAPTNGPLVVFPGSSEDAMGLERVLRCAIGGVAVLGVISVLIEAIARGLVPGLSQEDPAVDGPAIAEQPPEHGAVEFALGIPPGVLFFLGGLTVLIVILGIVWSKHHH